MTSIALEPDVKVKNNQNKWLLLLVLFFSCILVSSIATAKGNGIPVGNKGKFHPRLYVDSGYDNNIFRTSSASTASAAGLAPRGSIFFNVRPGMQLNIPTAPFGIDLSGYLNYSHYFDQLASRLSTFTAKADVVVSLFSRSAFSFFLTDNFSRSGGDTTTSNDVFDRITFMQQQGTPLGGSFISYNNRTHALFVIQPGGRAFRIELGYAFKFAINPTPDTDSNEHDINFNVKWTFFPKTALLPVFDFEISTVA